LNGISPHAAPTGRRQSSSTKLAIYKASWRKHDLLVVPGMDHGSGGAYGDHKRYDFFVRHLLGVNPPSWTAVEGALKPQSKSTSATSGR
jgi:hypothetical protein